MHIQGSRRGLVTKDLSITGRLLLMYARRLDSDWNADNPLILQGTTVYHPTRPWTLLLNSFEPNVNVDEMLIFSVNSRHVAVHDSRLASY